MTTKINYTLLKHLKFLLLLLLFTGNILSAETFFDMAGRNVNLPSKIEKILPYDSKTSIFMFPVASGIMAAKAMIPGSNSFDIVNTQYSELPELDIKNTEEILMYHPQAIIAGVFIPEQNYQRFDDLQNKCGIPVILIDLSIDKVAKSYEFLGKLLNRESRSEELCHYISSLYNIIDSLKKVNPINNSISAYYTIGDNGLMTDPSGSKHTEILDFLNIPNAAKLDIPSGGHAKASMEQIIQWNPDFIFCTDFKNGKNAYETITTSPLWSNIKAVKNNKVYKIPTKPCGWFDHPPTVTRIPGLIWLCHIFYGLEEDKELKLIREFYTIFFSYNYSNTMCIKSIHSN